MLCLSHCLRQVQFFLVSAVWPDSQEYELWCDVLGHSIRTFACIWYMYIYLTQGKPWYEAKDSTLVAGKVWNHLTICMDYHQIDTVIIPYKWHDVIVDSYLNNIKLYIYIPLWTRKKHILGWQLNIFEDRMHKLQNT